MHTQTKRELQAATLVAIAGTIIFAWGHGLVKGVLFGFVVFAIQAIPLALADRRRRREQGN